MVSAGRDEIRCSLGSGTGAGHAIHVIVSGQDSNTDVLLDWPAPVVLKVVSDNGSPIKSVGGKYVCARSRTVFSNSVALALTNHQHALFPSTAG